MNTADTIAAIASAPGGALRGVVRMSGPAVVECLRRCGVQADAEWPATIRRPAVRSLTLPLPPPFGPIPGDLYLWPGNRSYTRQPSAELHTIGSPPILDAVLRAICTAGARLAAPGEFTLRAFLAGRLDLTQAEAVLGVIDAQSQLELDAALLQLAGGLAKPLGDLRNRLLDLLAQLEASLDFVEEDIEFISSRQLTDELAAAWEIVQRLHSQLDRRSETRDEYQVVLVGSPNTGKSSLWNALSGEATAIVSHEAGTTRDYLVRRIDGDDLSCVLVDTAGAEALGNDAIGRAAQGMTRRQAEQAHLRLLCLDTTRPLNAWERQQIAAIPAAERLLVLTKCDQPSRTDLTAAAVCTSSASGQGIADLRQAIVGHRREWASREAGSVVGTAIRCRESLRLASDALQQAQQAVVAEAGEEIVAIEVRLALDELGKIAGVVYTEDVLDRIFGRFCVGK